MAVDGGVIALAGVRVARDELCRASGLLRRAIRVAAAQGVSFEQLAGAAGASVDQVRRIATGLEDPAGRGAGARAVRGGRGGGC